MSLNTSQWDSLRKVLTSQSLAPGAIDPDSSTGESALITHVVLPLWREILLVSAKLTFSSKSALILSASCSGSRSCIFIRDIDVLCHLPISPLKGHVPEPNVQKAGQMPQELPGIWEISAINNPAV
jgi:hypothetical protein